MNARKAKRIRQRLRAAGHDPSQVEKLAQPNGRIVIVPDSGRSIYRRIKQLGIE